MVASVLVACGGTKKPAAAPTTKLATVAQKCPDLAKVEELAAFDFAKEYALSQDAADKLKAAALATTEIAVLEGKLDAEFGLACAQIAHDLGNKGDWRSGNEACAAAIKATQDARAKLGSKATVQLVTRDPMCLVEASLVTKCASICDSSVPSAKVHAECEQKAGRCEGNCEGTCEPRGAAKCDGTCSGTCEGPMRGTCGGKCVGTCDGKRVNGPCLGTCAGTCNGGAIAGECKGTCTGSCKFAKAGICDGTCAGTCSIELAETKCAGELKVPEVSTDCRARCELAAMNRRECSAPQVGLIVSGTKDRETSEALRSTVEKAFPPLLKILGELGEQGSKRVLNAQAILDGARKGFRDMARSGGAPAAAEAQLVKCFDEPFKNAAASAASVKQGIDQAIGVRDEAVGAKH